MKCYNCDIPLAGENLSDEHIINNAIGGVKKSKELLCKKCNNTFGSTIDAAMEKQLAVYGFLLNIKLDRGEYSGKIKMMSRSGHVKYFAPGMIPMDDIKIIKEGVEVIFPVHPRRYKELIDEKKHQMEKKGQVQYRESIVPPPTERYFLTSILPGEVDEVAFGGPAYYRSIAKICLNQYLYKGYPKQYTADIRGYVKGIHQIRPIFNYYPSNEIVHTLEKDEVSHIIHIRGDKEAGVLYAYIELFNMVNLIAIFSMDYIGEDFSNTYCRDVLKRVEVIKDINLRLVRHHFEALPLMHWDMAVRQENLFTRLLRIIEQRQPQSSTEHMEL